MIKTTAPKSRTKDFTLDELAQRKLRLVIGGAGVKHQHRATKRQRTRAQKRAAALSGW